MVAADGERADVVGSRFSLDILQDWKRQRLLDRDAYVVQTHESTIRDPLALPAHDEGSVLVAPLFMRDEFRGLMIVSTPEEMPAPPPTASGRSPRRSRSRSRARP